MKRPSVSVCVPVYNAEKYISECLDSLLKQSLKNIEIICVDDGSTDSSGKVLDEYAKKNRNIKVVHQKNTGLGGARDAGVLNSRGEFIGFVDADDKVDARMFERLYNLAVKNKAEISYCNVRLSDDNSDKKVWFNPYNGKVDSDFLYRNTQPWNKIFSRALFERSNAKFRKDDSVCTYLMVKAKGIVSVDEKLYWYRVGHNSMSTSLKVENLVNATDSIIEVRNTTSNDKEIEPVLIEYFDFLVINNILQTLAVSVSLGERSVYNEQKRRLKLFNYRRNDYCKRYLKPEHGWMKYFAIMNILPNSYVISRFLICTVLGGRIR